MDDKNTPINAAHLTVLRHSSFIGKRFAIGKDGQIEKKSTATFYDGTAKVHPAPDASALVRILDGLQPRDVLSLGTLKGNRQTARIRSEERAQAGDLTRSKTHFEHQQGQGWLLLDHDLKAMPPEVRQRVADLGGGSQAIQSIWPELAGAERVFRPSSSGGVYIEGGSPTEATGFHLFVLLQDVSQSEVILKTLMARAWEAGLAWHMVSKNGSLLERSVIDASVGGPERLVFTAPPDLGAGVYRRPPETRIQRGGALAAPDMPEGNLWQRMAQNDRRRVKPEAEAAEAAFIDIQADKIAKQTGRPKAEAAKIARARIEGRILQDDDVLVLRDGSEARVGDLLDAHFTQAGAPKFSLPDPIDGLDYPTAAAILWGAEFAAPVLISHAHGIQVRYSFARHMTPEQITAQEARTAQRRAVERGDIPEAADLPDGRRETITEALAQADDRDTAMAVALAVIAKKIKLTPHAQSEEDLLQFILAGLPDEILLDDDVAVLRSRIEAINAIRKRKALGFSDISKPVQRELWRDHDVQTVSSLIGVSAALDGVTIIRAPMGAGKTQIVGQPWVEAARQQGSVMAMCHRVSLVDELAARLNLPHYQSAAPEEVTEAQGLAVCLPSITSDLVAETLPRPEFVFIDEISQVLRFLQSKNACRTRSKTVQDVFDELVAMVRNARGVLVADAGVDDRTIAFLKHCRPQDRFRMVRMKATPRQRQARVYGSADPKGERAKARVLDDVMLELAAGGKVWLACESAKAATDLGKVLEAEGHKVLTVTASTKGSEAEAVFLRNADNASRLYDLVVVSPAVVSGVSIEHHGRPHFTLGAFIGSGQAIVPSDAAQMLSRVRYLERFVIGLGGNNKAFGQRGADIVAGWQDLGEIENAPVQVTSFDAMRADIIATAANACADFSAGLFWMLEADGWQLEVAPDADAPVARAALKAAKEARLQQWEQAVLQCEVPDDMTAMLLRNVRCKTLQDAARIAAYDITQTLAIETVDAAAIEQWDEGGFKGRIERFEDLAQIGSLPEITHQTIVARGFRKARRILLAELFEGVDLQAAYPFTPEMQEVFLDRVMDRRNALVGAKILPEKFRSGPRPKHFKRVLEDLLARFGMRAQEQRRRVCRNTPLLYKDIQSEGIPAQAAQLRFYGIDPASWAHMQSISDRRQAQPTIKPEDVQLPQADGIRPIASNPAADLAAERRKRMASLAAMASHERLKSAGLPVGSCMTQTALALEALPDAAPDALAEALDAPPQGIKHALTHLYVIGLVGRDSRGRIALEGRAAPRKLVWAHHEGRGP